MKIKIKKTITLFSYLSSKEEAEINLEVIKHCISVFNFDEILIVCKCLEVDLSKFERLGAKIIEDELDSSYDSYNFFILNRLGKHLETDFVLTIQNDGFIINPCAWLDEYLEYDYIGSPWLNPISDDRLRVGNGGFSLRSKKMLLATKVLTDFCQSPSEVGNEDVFICHRERHTLENFFQIRVAPVELAVKFAVEPNECPEQKHIDLNDLSTYDTFGFHGLPHIPLMHSKFLKK